MKLLWKEPELWKGETVNESPPFKELWTGIVSI